MTYCLLKYPSFSEQNVAGYGTISPNGTVEGKFSGGFNGIFFMPNPSPENTAASVVAALQPILDHMTATWPSYLFQISNTTFPQFNDFFVVGSGPSTARIDSMIGSGLLDAEVCYPSYPSPLNSFTNWFQALNNVKAIRHVMSGMPPNGRAPSFVGGKGVKNAIPRGGSDAVNPAWRNALVHMSICAVSPKFLLL